MLSHVQLFWILGVIAHQTLLSMVFLRQECWSGLPFLSPGDFPNLGTEPKSPALQTDSLPLNCQESPNLSVYPYAYIVFKSRSLVFIRFIECSKNQSFQDAPLRIPFSPYQVKESGSFIFCKLCLHT